MTSVQKLAAGWTKEGIQVFCEQCEKNVLDLDFMGQKVKIYNPLSKQERQEKE